MNLIDKLVKVLLKNRNHITLQDKMVAAYAKGKKMPLKGHTRIIFTDTVTGKETVVADTTNMVTNAVASIFANNIGGLADFTKIMPLKNMYAGVLCFQNEITEDADNYLPPNETTNPLIAHAGQEMNSTVSTLRGDPVISDIVTTNTSVKWVWSWDSSHGNGTIRTICLCPEQLGNMGLKPIEGNTYNCWTNIAISNTAISGSGYTNPYTNSRESYFPYPISVDNDGKLGKVIYINGTTFEEITVRHDWLSFGIMRNINDFQEVSSRTCTVRNLSNAQIFQDDNYYYHYRINSATAIQIDKISKSDLTVTQADISISGASLYTSNFDLADLNKSVPKFAYDGTYLYLPKSSGDGFIGVNPNSGVIKDITGTVTLYLSTASSGAGKCLCSPVILGASMVYGDSYIINGDNVYPHPTPNFIGTQGTGENRRNTLVLVRNDVATYGYPACQSNYEPRGQGDILLGMFLSTINVLEEPVTKTNTVAMRIEYTISET